MVLDKFVQVAMSLLLGVIHNMSKAMGHLLRQWREERGWSREQLVDVICSHYSNQMGSGKGGIQISEKTIQRGESGKSSPTIRTLSIWLGALQGIPEERLDSFFSNLLNFVFTEPNPPTSDGSEEPDGLSDTETWREHDTTKWANTWWHKLLEFISEYHNVSQEMKQLFVQEHPKPVAKFFKAVSIQRALHRNKSVPNEAVLLVDDEEHTLKILADALSERYEVVTALNGSKALHLLKTDPMMERIGVIISDQRMPEMSGVEFLKASCEYLPHAQRILISAYADINAIIDSINKVHIFRFLQKPFAPSELQLAIEEAYHRYYEKKKSNELEQNLAELQQHFETKVEAEVKAYQQQNQMLQMRNVSKERFWHSVARDLRLPLQPYRSSDGFLRDKSDAFLSQDSPSEEATSIPLEQLDLFLVQALRWSQENTRTEQQQPSPSNLFQATQQAYNLVAQAATSKQLRIFLEIDLSFRCLVDEAMLCTVLTTLLSSSIQAASEQGEIRISATEEKEHLQIIIHDTNLEPSTADWEHPFAAPSQSDSINFDSRFRIHLCRRSVQSHGGNLFFQHEANKGSMTIFSVPKAPMLHSIETTSF